MVNATTKVSYRRRGLFKFTVSEGHVEGPCENTKKWARTNLESVEAGAAACSK